MKLQFSTQLTSQCCVKWWCIGCCCLVNYCNITFHCKPQEIWHHISVKVCIFLWFLSKSHYVFCLQPHVQRIPSSATATCVLTTAWCAMESRTASTPGMKITAKVRLKHRFTSIPNLMQICTLCVILSSAEKRSRGLFHQITKTHGTVIGISSGIVLVLLIISILVQMKQPRKKVLLVCNRCFIWEKSNKEKGKDWGWAGAEQTEMKARKFFVFLSALWELLACFYTLLFHDTTKNKYVEYNYLIDFFAS